MFKKMKYRYVIFTFLVFFSTVCMPYIAALFSYEPRSNFHWKETAQILYEEGTYPQEAHVKLDNWIDSNIILPAYLYSSKNFKNTIFNQSFTSYEKTKSLYLEIVSQDAQDKWNYSRYWNGVAPLIRILHNFMNINGIRLCFSIMLIALITLNVIQLIKKRLFYEIISLLFFVFLTDLFYLDKSLCYRVPFILGFLGSYCLLKNFKENSVYFWIGFLCWYYDRLTCPLISLAIPMLLCTRKLYLDKKASLQNMLRVFLIPAIVWLVGMLSSIILRGIFLSLFRIEGGIVSQIRYRSSWTYKGHGFSFFDVINKNLNVLIVHHKVLFFFMAGTYILFLIWNIFNVVKKVKKWDGYLCLGYFLICLSPLCVCLVLSNHSFEHVWLAYRNFSVLFCGFFMLLGSFIKNKI